ncbi:MAG: 4'-phosphopantetheinyl transferase superfamily protein [Pseudomonadota bacterium]|nr:4'-phosphopantetheinyl transferase superfamily protein [Pseudomonadota bacterium]
MIVLPELTRLFADGVVVHARRAPGIAEDLLPSEAESVKDAVPKRTSEFAAGRACARSALRALGVVDFPLQSAPDRQPIWPSGCVGSISHTTGLCAAAVAMRSRVAAVGLDIEVTGSASVDIWSTICRDEELVWVRSLPLAEQSAAVTLIFSAKEAVYKFQYPRVREWLDFHDLRLSIARWGAIDGSFAAHPTRQLGLARHYAVPIVGQYVFFEQFVIAGVSSCAHRPAGQ